MYATVTQDKTDGTKEVLVENYPIIDQGDLEKALEEARKLSVINDGVAFPEDVVRRDVIRTRTRYQP